MMLFDYRWWCAECGWRAFSSALANALADGHIERTGHSVIRDTQR